MVLLFFSSRNVTNEMQPTIMANNIALLFTKKFLILGKYYSYLRWHILDVEWEQNNIKSSGMNPILNFVQNCMNAWNN